MPVQAADGEIAGPGKPNQTIQQTYGGQTFQYGSANSGYGTFTMGSSDTTLTANYDAIYYRVIFDGTPNIGNPTITKNASGQNLYLDYDVTAFNKKMADQGNTGTSDNNGIQYTLRYDQEYQLPINDTFKKFGYTFVGWSTRMPQQEAEMESMATGQNGFSIVKSFDGTDAERQGKFKDNFYKNPDGTVQSVENQSNYINNAAATGQNILDDGATIKNLTYGGYAENEIITKNYKTVTLYAIWKLKNLNSNVYYQLQKQDGTYQYSLTDTSNVKAATTNIQSYIEIQNVDDFNSQNSYSWVAGGQAWNNRTIKSISRVYKYVGDNDHDLTYCQIDINDQLVPESVSSSESYYDTGKGIVLQTDGKNIFIQVPRKKVQLSLYGMIATNGSNTFYTNDMLSTDNGNVVGSFQLNAKNSDAIVRQVGDSSDQDVKFDSNGKTLNNLYKLQFTSYSGNQITIQNIKASSNNGIYTYQYKGYSIGNGNYQISQTTQKPQSTGTSFQVTLDNNKYVLMYFDRSTVQANPLEVKWNEMTRSYNDPYGIGTNGTAYSGQKTTGPWSVVTWKNFTVGNGQTTNKVYYMQLYLDNQIDAQQMGYDRLNINAANKPTWDASIELRRYYNNKDIIIIRFPQGITEAELQNWMRNNFQVITYCQPSSVQSRLHIFLTNLSGYYANDTGVPTGSIDWGSWAGNIGSGSGFIPSDSQTYTNAYLICDNTGIYWKYKYERTSTAKSQDGGRLQAGDRTAHSYSQNKWDYDHSGKTLWIPQSITQIPGFQNARAIAAGQSAETYQTQDNGIRVEVDGEQTVPQQSQGMAFFNGNEQFGGSWDVITGYKTAIDFDLWGGDCSTANTGAAWGEDHGGSMWNLWVNWEYRIYVEKTQYISLLEGVITPCYTIAKQYPVVIKYDISQGWGNETTWSWSGSNPGDNVMGFDYNWIYGQFARDNSSNSTYIKGVPTNYTRQLSTNKLSRYGYVWDGRWYIIYNQNNQPKQFNWLTNTVNGAGYSSQNLLTSKLGYNTDFGAIQNSQPYTQYQFSNYGYGTQDGVQNYSAGDLTNQSISKFMSGYVPFTVNEKSDGQAVQVNYKDILQLWMQSGGQTASMNITDSYTGNVQKQIECRVITLYAARTVPIQYTIKYASGGQDQFAGQNIAYSWSTGNYSTAGSINKDASATSAYKTIANSHALDQAASGQDATIGSWYRQQFVYDKESTLTSQQFSRPDNLIKIEGESLTGYQFIGWTTYKDTTGNNEQASYRNGSTKSANKGISQKTQTNDTTKPYGTSSADSLKTFNSGDALQVVQSSGSQIYNISETNPTFLTNGAQVKNLLNTVQKDSKGTSYTSGGQLVAPDVVYQDNFKWPEVTVYPNWRKQVTLTIQLDANCADTNSKGTINGKNVNSLQSSIYKGDYIYNNQYYYPVSIDRILYNSVGDQQFTSWRYSQDSLGINSAWSKNVTSVVKDKYLQPIKTEYRFLGLQFSDKATYPTSTGNTQNFSTNAINSVLKLPSNGALQVSQNERAYSQSASLSHKRIYALQTYDTKNKDADSYQTVISKFFSEPSTQSKSNGRVGLDESYAYYSTIDCYNNTTLYAVWEPVLTSSIEATRVGGSKLQSGDRANAENAVEISAENKAGTGFTVTTSLDGIVPTSSGDGNTYWGQESYNTQIEYKYNNNFNNEIVALYNEPIISNPNYKQVLDTLNNQATFTQNQVNGKTGGLPKIKTAHTYKSWQFYLPLYLGTSEMEKASNGAIKYDENKKYTVDVVAQRYSFYYANYKNTDEKDSEYPDNETVHTYLNISLNKGVTPPYNDPDDGNNGGNNSGGDSGDGGDAGSILDDLRVHVQLH